MLLINNINTDPYFNIAAEEYLLKQKSEEIFIVYVNDSSVIIGKHQNTLAEINYQYILENNIPVIRRISGGGTVYHDLGNLNFTIITNGNTGQLIDFNLSTQPVRRALERLGIETTNEGKNNLCVNGMKISGNAAHVYKNRVMHHGTLLVSTDLEKLKQAISVIPGKYIDNGVKSIRSNVLNLGNVNGLTIQNLRNAIIEEINKKQSIENYSFSNPDSECIQELISTRYNTWEWNYAYSPNYFYKNKLNDIEIQLAVNKGVIVEAFVKGIPALNEKLIGVKHTYFEIRKVFENNNNLINSKLDSLLLALF